MAATQHEPTTDESLADRLASAITTYDRLGVDGKGHLHYLGDDRQRVAVIEAEPERDLIDEAYLVQDIGGAVDAWIGHVEERRGWDSFDAEMVVALAAERVEGED